MKKNIKAILGLIVAFPQMLIFICCGGQNQRRFNTLEKCISA